MARTNLNTIEGDAGIETNETSAADVAWRAACEEMKFRIYHGEVLGGQGDCLYVVPAPADFDSVPAAVAGFLAYSIMKHVEYRVAQNAGGDLNEAAAKFIAELGSFKPERSMDAAQKVFQNTIADSVINRVVGEDGSPLSEPPKVVGTFVRKVPGPDGKPQLQLCRKGEQGANTLQYYINANIEVQKDRSFDLLVQRALERGRSKPTKENGVTTPRRSGVRNDEADLGFEVE